MIGDAVRAAFPTAQAAVAAAITAQRALQAEPWAALGLPEPLRVRTALHVCAAAPDETGHYRTPDLNRLDRLLAAGHGGQILLSDAVLHLARDLFPPAVSVLDLGAHRFRDRLEPEPVYQVVAPGLAGEFPPLASLDARRHNLPPRSTSLVGREREVAQVRALLQRPDVRLLTLTGAGGAGKTRLALAVAAELVDDFPDGTYFVPLAGVSDPAQVPAAVAAALALVIREFGATSLPDRLWSELAGTQTLLVLDTFEHVIEAASWLTDLLAACPGLKVLVSSRMALQVRAEHEFPVQPLALPRRQPPPGPAELTHSAAGELFVERARAIQPGFVVDTDNAPAIAELCHRLDGLPLAIELAAAQVQLLSPDAMLARLDQRLPFLAGDADNRPERHRTLRQTIAWSYDLLTPEERALLRSLSVFAGAFTVAAAEAVAGEGMGLGGLDLVEGLERLTDQNLLRHEESRDDDLRFSMLETIRAFALDELVNDGGEARRHHALHFLNLAAEAETASPLAAALEQSRDMRGHSGDEAASPPAASISARLSS